LSEGDNSYDKNKEDEEKNTKMFKYEF